MKQFDGYYRIKLFGRFMNHMNVTGGEDKNIHMEEFWSVLTHPKHQYMMDWIRWLNCNKIHYTIDADTTTRTKIYPWAHGQKNAWCYDKHFNYFNYVVYYLIIPNKNDAMRFKLIFL